MNEHRLWQLLRSNQPGVHFRRQAPVMGYCLDFLAAEVRLVVELDGPTHETAKGKSRDMVRDRRLAARGLKVLRIRDEEMSRDPDAVIARIRSEIEKRRRRARIP